MSIIGSITPDGYLAFISAIIAVLTAFFLNKFFQDKSNVIAYYSHIGALQLRNTSPPMKLFTHVVTVRNDGNKLATNIKINHAVLPIDYYIWPENIEYVENPLPNNGRQILIPNLVPKEEIQISYLYDTSITFDKINNGIKHDGGYAKVINVKLVKAYKKSTQIFLLLLLVLGATVAIYFLIKLIILVLLIV